MTAAAAAADARSRHATATAPPAAGPALCGPPTAREVRTLVPLLASYTSTELAPTAATLLPSGEHSAFCAGTLRGEGAGAQVGGRGA
jgi:hypothetical protein